MWIGCGQPVLRNFFYSYGRIVGRHPLTVLAGSLLVAFAFLYGFLSFTRVGDLEELFSPKEAPSKEERERFNKTFREDAERGYSRLRSPSYGQYLRLVVTAVDGDVLSPAAIDDVRQLDSAVRAMKTTYVINRVYTYEDICGKSRGQCPQDPVLRILRFQQRFGGKPSQIRFPVHEMTLPSGESIDVFLGYSLGGVSDEGGNTTAKAWKLQYSLQPNHPTGTQWQLDALTLVKRLNLPHITVFPYTARSIREELRAITKRVAPLFLVSFGLLVAFSAVSLLSCDWLQAKPLLAVAGVMSSCLAIPSAVGLCSQFGIPAADIVATCPFLIIGIGVDATFVMVAAWRQTSHRQPVDERMALAYANAALGVTITTLTDVLAIGVGAFTQFETVHIFCVFAGAGIAFDFFYQMTFFGACMALSGRREAEGKHPVACTAVTPASEAKDRNVFFRWFCTGGDLDGAERPTPWSISFFRDTWANILNNVIVKVFVAVFYVAYLAMAVWGCIRVREGIHLSNLAIDGSYVSNYYHVDDRYFTDYDLPVAVLIDGEIAPWQKKDWNYMEQMLRAYERDSNFFHGANTTFAWTRRFDKEFGTRTVWDRDNFTRAYSAFMVHPANHIYALDVKWNMDKTAIVGTRFHVVSKRLNTTVRETAMMRRARKIASDATRTDTNVTVFHPSFIFYDIYAVVAPTTLRNLALATAAMFLVSLLLIPSFACTVFVTLSIASICVGVIGFMTWWGVNMDSVSMIHIIMSIGFSVDFSAHITNAFVGATGQNQLERMRNALALVGYPIVQSAASTILAISILGVAPGYVIRAFFKIMFLVVVFGVFHGLLVIPELLLAFGGIGRVKVHQLHFDERRSKSPRDPATGLPSRKSSRLTSSSVPVGETGDKL